MPIGLSRRVGAIDFIPTNGAGEITTVGDLGGVSGTGETITPALALNVSAFWRGLNLISTGQAMLPLLTYQRIAGGKQRATEHRLYDTLHRNPNPEMTAFTYKQTVAGHVVAWGNGYSEIVRDGRGRPLELWPLRPDRMIVERERDTQELRDGNRIPRRQYKYTLADGSRIILRADQVHHVKGLGFDGRVGYPVLTLMRQTLALTRAADAVQAASFKNNARPGVILTHPRTLSDEARDNLASSWKEAHEGLTNAQRTAILEEGVTATVIGFSPEDAQFLQSRAFQVLEMARWLGLPPHKLYELSRATFSNIEQQALEYLTDSLNGWLVNDEQQKQLDLFTVKSEDDGFFPEYERNALMQVDARSRAFFYQTMRWLGVMNGDDIADRENLNRLPDGLGQRYFVPMNMDELMADGSRAGGRPAGATIGPADETDAMATQSALSDLTFRLEDLEQRLEARELQPAHRNGDTP